MRAPTHCTGIAGEPSLCFTRPRVTAADSEGEWFGYLEGKTTRAVLAKLKDA